MNKTTSSNFYNKSKHLPVNKTEKFDGSIIKLSDEKKYFTLNRQDFNSSIIQKCGEIIINKLPVRRTNHISFIYDKKKMEPNNSNMIIQKNQQQVTDFNQNNQNINQRNNQNDNNIENPSNNSIRLGAYKKEMIINFAPQVMQTSMANWLINYINNNNAQLNNFQAQLFAN